MEERSSRCRLYVFPTLNALYTHKTQHWMKGKKVKRHDGSSLNWKHIWTFRWAALILTAQMAEFILCNSVYIFSLLFLSPQSISSLQKSNTINLKLHVFQCRVSQLWTTHSYGLVWRLPTTNPSEDLTLRFNNHAKTGAADLTTWRLMLGADISWGRLQSFIFIND